MDREGSLPCGGYAWTLVGSQGQGADTYEPGPMNPSEAVVPPLPALKELALSL